MSKVADLMTLWC